MTKEQKSSSLGTKKPYNQPPTEKEYILIKERAKVFSKTVQKNLHMRRDNLKQKKTTETRPESAMETRSGSAIKTRVRGPKWLKEAKGTYQGNDNKKQEDPNHPVYGRRFIFNIGKFNFINGKIGQNGYTDKFEYNVPPSDKQRKELRDKSIEFSEKLRANLHMNRGNLRQTNTTKTRPGSAIETRATAQKWLNEVKKICKSGNESLIAAGDDVNATNKDYKSLQNQSKGMVEAVAKQADDNEKSKTPLHLAVLQSNIEEIKSLIEAGADVNATNKDGETPLHLAAKNERLAAAKNESLAKEVIESLIEAGANVNATNKDEDTPLHLAAKNEKLATKEVIESLIKAKADINATNKDGETPLHILSLLNVTPQKMESLIAAGADVNSTNKDEDTPLLLAVILNNLRAMESLIAAGADVNATNKDGKTPLLLACDERNTKAIESLIAAGADVNATKILIRIEEEKTEPSTPSSEKSDDTLKEVATWLEKTQGQKPTNDKNPTNEDKKTTTEKPEQTPTRSSSSRSDSSWQK